MNKTLTTPTTLQLSILLKDIIPASTISLNSLDPAITHLTEDSRQVKTGSLFLAYPGAQADGRHYIRQALQQGAAAVLYEAEAIAADYHLPTQAEVSVPLIAVPNLQTLQSQLAARFYGDPSSKMQVIGVTGTNGKTSCTHYLAQILATQQQACAVAGTVGNGFLSNLQTGDLTTAGAIHLQQNLAEFLRGGANYVAMEVSSHSLVQHRVDAVHFSIAVLTQLSRDHLDYHGTMAAYAAAKAQLFARPGLQAAVLNWDDELGQQLVQRHEHDFKVVTYSAAGKRHPHLPSVIAQQVIATDSGLHVVLDTPWGQGEVDLPLLGEFNVSNVMAVIGVLGLLEVPFAALLAALTQLTPVCGRMQAFTSKNRPQVIVDYAHTPDALAQALQSLRAHRPRQLWCVFGCGGDRDRGKRPLMAQAAQRYADHIVITNDNPRTESPQQIIADICAGLTTKQEVIIELDRAAAIAYAIAHAQIGDMVLIAGKGHEIMQIIGQQRLAFSDQAQVMQCLK